MSDKKIVVGVIAASLLILVGGVVLAGRAPKPPEIVESSQAKVEVDERTHNWGDIQLKGGDVEKTFTFKNIGSDPLQLANIKTSCMCTKAQITIGEEKSPFFGMHSTSSWMGEVDPGEEAQLLVIFDPAYHGPSGTGQISRIISIETNDIDNSNLEFILSANVIN